MPLRLPRSLDAVSLAGYALLLAATAAVLYRVITASTDLGGQSSGPASRSSSAMSTSMAGSARLSSGSPLIQTLCGNAVVDPGEQCDEGRLNDIGPCTSACRFFTCGDGILSQQSGEECEPRRLDASYTDPATGVRYERGSFAPEPACGIVCSLPVYQQGGSVSGGCKWKFLPACRSSSSVPAALPSSSVPSSKARSSVASTQAQPPPARPVCGNGAVEAGESCDQGARNANQPNACRPNCMLPRCGDGIRDPFFGEACDDGALNANGAPDACRADCSLPRCGDGTVDSGEECDGGDGCAPDCSYLKQMPRCGDGRMDPGEECDDGNRTPADGCSAMCAVERAFCGDGVLQGPEACDDGADNSDQLPDACRTTCVRAFCGDGVPDAGEECDDGNRESRDFCSNACTLAACGNGIVEADEQCDDGNIADLDGCSALCRVETPHASAGEPGGFAGTPMFIASILGFLAGAGASLQLLRTRKAE